MSTKYMEMAAQLWCLPQHAHKEMDVDFAMSIENLLKQVAREALEEAAVIASVECVESFGSEEDVGQCGLNIVAKSIRAKKDSI